MTGELSLRRIKAHCTECDGNDHTKERTARLLDVGICNLHNFGLLWNSRPLSGGRQQAGFLPPFSTGRSLAGITQAGGTK